MIDNTINENLVQSQGSPTSGNKNGVVNTKSKPLENSVMNTTPLSFLDNVQNPNKPLSFLDDYNAPKPKFEGNIYDQMYKESSLDTSNRDFLTGGEDMFTRNLEHVRGERQGAGAQVLKGVSRVGTKVASEVLKIPGYIGGAAIAPFIDNEGSVLDTIFNNQYVKGIANAEGEVNNSLLAVYQSEKTDKGEGFENFLNNISSTSFWASDGADGIGFLVSMMVPGLILSKANVGAKLLGSAATAMERIGISASKYEALYGMASKGLTKANMDVGISTLANTFIEAGAEAAGAINNFEEGEREIISKKFQEGQNKLLVDMTNGLITPEEYETLSSEILENLENQLKEQKGELGSNIFKANLAILLGPNLLQSKMLYGGLAKNSNLTLTKPKTIKKAAAEFGKGFASEGFWEEGMQTTVENYYSKKANNLDLKGFLNDTTLGGVYEEYLNTLTTSDGMKSIFLGGMLGGPMSAYHNVKNAKNNFNRSLAMTSLIDANITNSKAVNMALYKTDEEGNYELDSEGKPIIDPTGALIGLRQVANSAAVTDYISTLLGDSNIENVDSTILEAFELVQNSYLNSVASGLITTDPDGSLSLDALKEQFEKARQELKENENITEDQKKAQELILNKNESILKRSLEEAKIQNEVFDTLSEVMDFNSLNFENANALDQTKIKESFIKNVKPSFINNQLQIKMLEQTRKGIEEKIDKLESTFKEGSNLTTELKENLDSVNKEIERREKERDGYFGNIENMQTRLDEEVIPQANEDIAKAARADKLTSLIKQIEEAEDNETLDSIVNDEPLIKTEFEQALTARRKEIKEQEEALKKETKKSNIQENELNKEIPNRKLNYDQLDGLFQGLGDKIPLTFKNEILDSFEDSLVHDTIEDYVNDPLNEEYIQSLIDKYFQEEVAEVEKISTEPQPKIETTETIVEPTVNHVNPLLGEVNVHNIYDIIDFNGIRYIISDIEDSGDMTALRLDNTSVSRGLPSGSKYPAYNIGVEVFEDRGYPYHRIEGVLYNAEFKVIGENDSSYNDLNTIFDNGVDVEVFYPDFIKSETIEELSKELEEEVKEETLDDVEETVEDLKEEILEEESKIDDKFEDVQQVEEIVENVESEDIDNKNIEDVVNDSFESKDNISAEEDIITYQKEVDINDAFVANSFYESPRIMTYNTNFDEFLNKYENREGSILTANISDNLFDLGLEMKFILDSYYESGEISEEDIRRLIYHLPIKVSIMEGNIRYVAYIDAFTQDIENGIDFNSYNGRSGMQAMPLRIQIINSLLESKGKDVHVKISKQFDGNIQLAENNENSNISELKELEKYDETGKAKYFQNNFMYTDAAFTKTVGGKNHSKVLGKPGDIFLNMSTSKGSVFPLKVNQGKFTPELASAFSKLVMSFTSKNTNIFKTKLDDVISSIKPDYYAQIEGQLKPYIEIAKKNYGEDVKIVEFLNIIVNNGTSDKNRLSFDRGNIELGTAFFKANKHLSQPLQEQFSDINNGKINGSEFNTEESRQLFEEALSNYLNYLNRNIKVDLLGDLNYVKELIKSGAITTNTDTSVNLFGTPRVFIDSNILGKQSHIISRGLIENDPLLNNVVKEQILRSYPEDVTPKEEVVKIEDVIENIETTIEDLTVDSTTKKKEIVEKKKEEVSFNIENVLNSIKEMKPRQKIKYLFDLQKEMGIQRSGDINIKNVDAILESLITENENNPLLKLALEKLC